MPPGTPGYTYVPIAGSLLVGAATTNHRFINGTLELYLFVFLFTCTYTPGREVVVVYHHQPVR